MAVFSSEEETGEETVSPSGRLLRQALRASVG